MVRRYDVLYQAGMVVWRRRSVEAHIHALQSRIVLALAAAVGKKESEKEENKVG